MGFQDYFTKVEAVVRAMDDRGQLSGWEMQGEYVVLWFAPSRDSEGWIVEVNTRTLKAIRLELPKIGETVHSAWSEPYDFC